MIELELYAVGKGRKRVPIGIVRVSSLSDEYPEEVLAEWWDKRTGGPADPPVKLATRPFVATLEEPMGQGRHVGYHLLATLGRGLLALSKG